METDDNKPGSGPPARSDGAPSKAWVLAAAFIAALILRGASAAACGAATPQEVRYITIAQGLLEGRGFEGLDKRFPDVIQPPVLPFVLAAALSLGGPPLATARGVSVLVGALLVFPVAFLTRRTLGTRVAHRAAWLVSVYPLLVHVSGLSLTEPVFTLLLVSGAVYVHKAVVGEGRGGRAALAGVLLALSFLTRPEGLAYLVMGCALIVLLPWWSSGRALRPGLRLGLIAALAFTAACAPNSLWLRYRTGRWIHAPKALLTQIHNAMMADSLKENWPERYGTTLFYERVKFGLNDQGTEMRSTEAFRESGLLRPGPEVPAPKTVLAGEVFRPMHTARIVVENLRIFYLKTIKYGLVIPTMLLALLALGFLGNPWRPGEGRRDQIFLLGFVLAGGSWALTNVQERFLYPSVAFLIPLMARGWIWIEDWLQLSFGRPEAGPEGRSAARAWLVGVLVTAACLVHVVPPAAEVSNRGVEQHRAGEWLARNGSPGSTVMALTAVASFYARMQFEMLPYGDLDRVLGYARAKGVRYLITEDRGFRRFRPQLAALLDPSTAPLDFRTLHRVGDEKSGLMIYEVLSPVRR